MSKTFTIILILIGFLSFGQEFSIAQIKDEVKRIDTDSTLIEQKFDWVELTGITTDGGGILKIWRDGDQICKIIEEIGLSYGRIRTIIYLKNEFPIKIVETEENFEFSNNEINLSKLEEVFRIDIYVFGTNKEIEGLYDYQLNRIGNRVLSDGFCELSDFFSTIDRAEKALRK